MFSLKEQYQTALFMPFSEDSEYYSLVSDLFALKQVQSLDDFEQHAHISRLRHTFCVSYLSYKYCQEKNLNYKSAARAGLLHDLFYYDWRKAEDNSHRLHGFRHPGFALKNALEITNLSAMEQDIIKKHMWPLTVALPKFRESLVVSLIDKYCATMEVIYSKNTFNLEKKI
ncbi:MAG: hypothetical protein Q4E28_03430 [Clostridia bacterium]|nr:hypothetical protein [Clostridia bacterium]